MQIASVLWLLPIVFMLHDFEEIIMMRPWVDKNSGELARRFPRLAPRILPHLLGLSTSAFALAVAEEFLILAVIAFLAVEYQYIALWTGVLNAFCIHLLAHLIQFIVYRRYVPVIVTTFPALAYCIGALVFLSRTVGLRVDEVATWTVIAVVIVALNLAAVHILAARFDCWLKQGCE